MISTLGKILFVLLLIPMAGFSQTLEEGFRHPPAAAKPWVFWYWMQAAVSKEGIRADLEAMRSAGIGGAYLMPIKGVTSPPLTDTPVEQLSPAWWEMVRYAMQEADRLGVKLAMHVCDGFAVAGGPWITPEMSMQKVTWSKTFIEGKVDMRLPAPPMHEGYYRDVALYALPVSPGWEQSTLTTPSKVSPGSDQSTRTVVPKVTSEGATIKDGSIRCDGPCWVQYAFDQPFTCRTIIVSATSNYQAQRLLLEASDDGEHFRQLGRLEPPRHGWEDNDADVTHTIPAVTARYFRFVYDKIGSEPGAEDLDAAKWKPSLKVGSIGLSAMPSINQYEGKAGEVWRISRWTTASQLPDSICIDRARMVDISRFMDTSGHLVWTAPPGHWMILRVGHTSTGHRNVTGGGGAGLECDKLNAKVAALQFDKWFGETIRRVGPELAGRVLKIFHVDSWECGSQNWSPVFREEFRRRRGYDCLPWLPVITGIPLGSADSSEKFLHDVRETIVELIEDNFYRTLATLAHAKGCVFSAESVAPTMTSDGMLHYQTADIPMGEFWLRSPTHDKPNDMLDAISGAHIYGKRIIQAEGFTELRLVWDEYPGMLKALQDRNYALGCNRLVLHVFMHNPWMDRRPGMTLDGIGTFLQRDQTWWKPGKAWIDYTQRCQWLLQQGRPVADIAVFTGEEVPRRALLPEKLVADLPGLFGEERVRSEALRLENAGEPVTKAPNGVAHAANMADPADWVNPLNGYAYDCINPDAVLRLGRVEHGRLVLPGGANYGVLVVPAKALVMNTGARLREWEKEGMTIIRTPFKDTSLDRLGLPRDFIALADAQPAREIAYTHRTAPGLDIYFVSNQLDETRSLEVSLRVNGLTPQLWDAVTGEIMPASGWSVHGGRTLVPITLPANGSIFIVLQRSGKLSPTVHQSPSTRQSPLTRQSSSAHQTPLARQHDTSTHILTGPWTVQFNPALGGPAAPVIFQQLTDWSRNPDTAISYYSGTAVYSKSFEWDGATGRRWLDLGHVANIAAVKLNGIDCGVAWTAPYRVEITKALRRGTNHLEISVTNTWANRLIDDHRLPPDRRITWTTAPYHLDGKLLKAGLIGEVNIIY